MDHHDHERDAPVDATAAKPEDLEQDGLTGLPTHRRLIATCGASQFGAVLVDVDGLIWLNDHEGFAAGDHALISIAAIVRDLGVASGGVVYRVGGDEFLVCVEGGDRAGLMALATRIVERVRAAQIPYHRADRPGRDVVEVNAAVGHLDSNVVASGIGEYRLTGDLRDLLERAVYDAKQRTGVEAGVVAEF